MGKGQTACSAYIAKKWLLGSAFLSNLNGIQFKTPNYLTRITKNSANHKYCLVNDKN